MKMTKIALLLIAVLLQSQPPAAGGNDAKDCRKVVVTFKKGDNYLKWVELGEDPTDERRSVKGLLERYFVGDPIRGRLYLASRCTDPPLYREVLESATACLSVHVYRMEKNEYGKYRKIDKKPLAKGLLYGLKIDRNDSWNKERKDKLQFRSDEGHSEGLQTEYFNIRDVVGRRLPVGGYILEIVADNENCKIQFIMHGQKRWIKVLEPDTPKLKAYKLCLEAGKITIGHSGDLAVLKKAISEKILPALEIDPGAVCAFGYLATYNRYLGNREGFEKYFRAFCDGQVDKQFREACLRGLKHHLANWDNPRWWAK